MPLATLSGKRVVDSGSFSMGLEDTEAEFVFKDLRIMFRVDANAEKLTHLINNGHDGDVYLLRPHQAGQVSVFRSTIDVDELRYTALFTIQGSASAPASSGATIISYSVTESDA